MWPDRLHRQAVMHKEPFMSDALKITAAEFELMPALTSGDECA